MGRVPNHPLFLRVAERLIVCLGVWMVVATSALHIHSRRFKRIPEQ